MFRITTPAITDGLIDKRFGKFGTQKIDGVPICSLPIAWSGVPEGTKSLALVMQDYDAVPVCGFSWIHWLVADIDPRRGMLIEDTSRADPSLIQGKNSLASKQICGELSDDIMCYYGWPRPPDQDHEYEIRIFALDTVLGLSRGFRYNELVRAMRGHILAESAIYGWYPASE